MQTFAKQGITWNNRIEYLQLLAYYRVHPHAVFKMEPPRHAFSVSKPVPSFLKFEAMAHLDLVGCWTCKGLGQFLSGRKYELATYPYPLLYGSSKTSTSRLFAYKKFIEIWCVCVVYVLLHIIASLSACSSVSRCPTFSQKGDGLALAPCTASPADAMDVVLAILLCSKHFLAGSHVQRRYTSIRSSVRFQIHGEYKQLGTSISDSVSMYQHIHCSTASASGGS